MALQPAQARRLWFTVRGGSTTRYYEFARKAAIQVTFLIAMPVEQFYGPDLVTNLALLLSSEERGGGEEWALLLLSRGRLAPTTCLLPLRRSPVLAHQGC